MQVIEDKIYASDIVPNEVHYNLHQRARLSLTLWDCAKLMLGKRAMLSLCLRLIVVKDEEDRFVDIDTDRISSRVVIVDSLEEAETVEAKFSHDFYGELHE